MLDLHEDELQPPRAAAVVKLLGSYVLGSLQNLRNLPVLFSALCQILAICSGICTYKYLDFVA